MWKSRFCYFFQRMVQQSPPVLADLMKRNRGKGGGLGGREGGRGVKNSETHLFVLFLFPQQKQGVPGARREPQPVQVLGIGAKEGGRRREGGREGGEEGGGKEEEERQQEA